MKGLRLPDSVYADSGPTKIRSCVAGDRYPEERSFQGGNSLPVVSFSRTHFRICFVVSSPEGPTGRRGLLARGAYWPQGEALAPVASPLATPLASDDQLIFRRPLSA